LEFWSFGVLEFWSFGVKLFNLTTYQINAPINYQ